MLAQDRNGLFIFPVPEEAVNAIANDTVQPGLGGGAYFTKVELLQVMLEAICAAWAEIEPLLPKIREQPIAGAELKKGADFFTQADTNAESAIRRKLFDRLGTNNIRFYGEEHGEFGNPQSRLGIRCDPVEGTRAMKFARLKWGIAVGIYEGFREAETQIMSAAFYPELRYQPLLLYVAGVGVFVCHTTERTVVNKLEAVPDRDSLREINVMIWKHTDVEQRGAVNQIEDAVSRAGGHAISTESACSDVLEAALTGRRAMVIDGDYNLADFIVLKPLEALGFRMFRWNGEEINPDDPSLVNQKLVVVPPGRAGGQLLDIVKGFAQ